MVSWTELILFLFLHFSMYKRWNIFWILILPDVITRIMAISFLGELYLVSNYFIMKRRICVHDVLFGIKKIVILVYVLLLTHDYSNESNKISFQVNVVETSWAFIKNQELRILNKKLDKTSLKSRILWEYFINYFWKLKYDCSIEG